jgi:hypothetical protein
MTLSKEYKEPKNAAENAAKNAAKNVTENDVQIDAETGQNTFFSPTSP